VIALLAPFAYGWYAERVNHSVTDDAFVEAHIVNIGPQSVSGHIVRFLVEENDRVEQGQLLAEIDPVPYRDQVAVARAKLDSARADLKRQQASLVRLKKEVPLQIAISRRSLVAARADQTRAEKSLEMTEDDVEQDVEEAQAGLAAARAAKVLADQEYTRFTRLYSQQAVAQRRSQEVTRARDSALAEVKAARAKLAKARSARLKVDINKKQVEAARAASQKAAKGVDLSETGHDQIREAELLVEVKRKAVEEARRGLAVAENQLSYTRILAPFPGVVVKRYRNLGDFASAGVAVLSMYNPDLLYVTANLEETRLPGVAPGNPVELRLDAFAEAFQGRVVWINKSTGAQFSLMPRNVVSGEFTKVVQRVPVRIAIEKDDRWPQLRAGLSVQVVIAHGPGDPQWAEQAAREMRDLETRYNQRRPPNGGAGPGNQP
jgi:membrane fusion protein (multidrug efflux system)